MTDRQNGTVKFFNSEKGYGFIQRDGEKDIFVHVKQVKKAADLREGDKVTFSVDQGPRGAFATDVERVAA
jgi:CspA family cold shock protein